MTSSDVERISATIASLLADRAADATLCPSEVARALVVQNKGEDWRIAMPVVHAAVDALMYRGALQLSWKGKALETRSGPYRIALGSIVQSES